MKNGSGNGKPKNGKGRPSLYRPEYAQQAYRLCLVGHTNAELARAFGISEPSIDRWIASYPEFRGSIKAGREEADADVAQSLYRRALGSGKAPPDTAACIFWLKNRQRLYWREKQEVEHSGQFEVVGPSPDEVWAALERRETREALGRLLRSTPDGNGGGSTR